MVEPGVRSLEAQERMVIDVGVAAVAAVERGDDVVLRPGVYLIRRYEAEHLPVPAGLFLRAVAHEHGMRDALHLRGAAVEAHQLARAPQLVVPPIHRVLAHRKLRDLALAPDHIDGVAKRVGEPHALAATRLVDVLDAASAGGFRDFLEVFLGFDVKAEAEELGRSKVRDVDVRGRIGAAHVKAVVRALGAHHAEAGQELFGLVQARRLQPAEREVGHFDDGHLLLLLLAFDARIITAQRAGSGKFESAQGESAQLLRRGAEFRGEGVRLLVGGRGRHGEASENVPEDAIEGVGPVTDTQVEEAFTPQFQRRSVKADAHLGAQRMTRRLYAKHARGGLALAYLLREVEHVRFREEIADDDVRVGAALQGLAPFVHRADEVHRAPGEGTEKAVAKPRRGGNEHANVRHHAERCKHGADVLQAPDSTYHRRRANFSAGADTRRERGVVAGKLSQPQRASGNRYVAGRSHRSFWAARGRGAHAAARPDDVRGQQARRLGP